MMTQTFLSDRDVRVIVRILWTDIVSFSLILTLFPYDFNLYVINYIHKVLHDRKKVTNPFKHTNYETNHT